MKPIRQGVLLVLTALLSAPAAASAESTPARFATYRLMAFNVASAANIPLGPRQIGQIADVIIDNAVDIAGLTEVDLGTDWHDGRDHLAELCVALADRGYPMHLYKWPSFPYHGGWQTPGIVSRFPIIESGYDVIDPPDGNPWCVGHITVNVARDTPVRAYMTHFWPQGDAGPWRQAVERLADLPNSFAGPRTIMGDFNLTPNSTLYNLVTSKGWQSSCQALIGSPCPTVQGTGAVAGPLPLTAQIDYIFASPEVEFLDSYVGYFSMSDHWPIVAEIRVKANGQPTSISLPDTTATRSDEARARADAASFYRKHDYQKAAAAYRKWEGLCLDRDDAGFAAYSAAAMHLLDGDRSEALEAFQRVVQTYPKTEWATRAVYQTAFLHKQAERWAQAECAFLQFLDGYYTCIHPDEPKSPAVLITAQEIAACRSAAGEKTDANHILEELRKRDPASMLARSAAYRLAFIKMQAGDYRGAAPYLEQADPPLVGWSVSESRQLAETYLASGNTRRADQWYDYYLASITNPLHRRVRVARWAKRRHPENFRVIVPAVADITIDGDLSDWQTAPTAQLRGPHHIHLFNQADPGQEMAATLRLGQTNDALIVAVDVTDKKNENPHTGKDIFMGDCLQIAIDPAANATSAYDTDDFETGFALTETGLQQVVFFDTQNRDFSGIRAAARHENGHTRYEVAIPKPLIETNGHMSDRIGFDILIGYADGTGRLGWLDWTPGIGEEKSPLLYPTLILKE